MSKRAPTPAAPWLPAPYEDLDVYAFKALARGEANDFQQKRVLDWIITKAAGTYDMSFRPECARSSDFAEGKRFVGNSIVKMVNYPAAALGKKGKPSERV